MIQLFFICNFFKEGLSQKTVFAQGSKKIFSFFNFNKKLRSNFLLKLKKENKISCRRQSVVF